MDEALYGRVAVITGGGAGIGSETARELARQGARVVDAERRLCCCEAVPAELLDDAIAWRTDVSSRASVHDAIRAVVEHYGRIDTVIANAGIAGPTQPMLTADPAESNG